MTVRELIEVLSQMDPDRVVVLQKAFDTWLAAKVDQLPKEGEA